MAIRKSFMSIVQMTSLSFLALAVLPARASDPAGNVTLTFKITDSTDGNHFSIHATNRGDVGVDCKGVEVKLKNKDGEDVPADYADPAPPYHFKLRAGQDDGIGSGIFKKGALGVKAEFTKPTCTEDKQ